MSDVHQLKIVCTQSTLINTPGNQAVKAQIYARIVAQCSGFISFSFEFKIRRSSSSMQKLSSIFTSWMTRRAEKRRISALKFERKQYFVGKCLLVYFFQPTKYSLGLFSHCALFTYKWAPCTHIMSFNP